jgi:hypothetical protein
MINQLNSSFTFLGYILFIGLTKPPFQKSNAALDRLFNLIEVNPKKTIIFIGVIAVVISCYPVIFLGKSFVHPVETFALYSTHPMIPGVSLDASSENFRKSDVGAMAWCLAPNSVVQHDSLFRYYEFPFWNRYVGGGVPLFAQGQSMLGDVLHWFPVILNGSAIGWDIKFILSKAVFAIGMGLLVFRLTDTLLAGALIAFSSCFLGFFAFRFNHPAFFVLTYAPWVVLQWDRLGSSLAFQGQNAQNCLLQGVLLALVTWLQLNAGATKEGVITACFMQALGVLAFWVHISPKWGYIRSLIFSCGMGLALVMITAPYWLLFLDTLSKSYTIYDIPGVKTIPVWEMVGFFDNFFSQMANGHLVAPSVNLFVLICMSCALLNLRVKQSIMVYGCWALFALAMATAYSIIPASILISIPFINKIQHVGNTFSVPMMLLALFLAGYGIRDYLEATKENKRIFLLFSLSCLIGLWSVYALNCHECRLTVAFFSVSFVIVLVGVFLLYQRSELGVWTRRGLLILMCCFLMLHIRHGMHLFTGYWRIDDNVMNPTERPDFSKKSNAIEYVKNRIEKAKLPTRVIGEGYVFFPGYNSRLGLEGIESIDALRSKNYENLLSIIDYPDIGWGWLRLIKSEQIADRAASLDLLGVGYILAMPGTKMPQDMKLVHSSDLDVWQRDSVWPRAFFVNQITEIHDQKDILVALTDKLHTPFATVESPLIPSGLLDNNTPFQVVPAREYRLTNNSTYFSVDASGPGIIVLGETYYPGDFIATINGEKVDYFRVNEASKGIWVDKAGKYDVNFTYKPEKLNQSLWLCLFGWALMLLLIIMHVRFPARLKYAN